MEGFDKARSIVLELLDFCRQDFSGIIADALSQNVGINLDGRLTRAQRQLLLNVALAPREDPVDLLLGSVGLGR